MLLLRGKRAPAESAFVRAGAEHAPDSLTAALNLAVLHFDRGERDRAMKEFDRFIDVYNASAGARSHERRARRRRDRRRIPRRERSAAVQGRAQGVRPRAVGRSDERRRARVKLGELFLRKYNFADAQTTFEEVLQTNPNNPRALLGAARRLQADGQAGGDSLLRARSTSIPTTSRRARCTPRCCSISRTTRRAADIDRALRVNPTAEHALAVAAAIKYLTHDQAGVRRDAPARAGAQSERRRLYSTLAELTAQVRLYRAAADFAKQGVALDPKDWHAWSVLGMNQLRLGQIADGRKSLETSFAGDPYNVWVKNTLDLLDTYKNYDLDHERAFSVHDREDRVGDSVDLPEGSRRAGVRDVLRRSTRTRRRRRFASRCIAATRTSPCARLVSRDSARSA